MSTTLDDGRVGALAGQVSGLVVSPRDAGYDEARAIHNGLVDRRPALIVRCRTTADVIAALEFARSAGLEVSVRGGGHNVAGRAVTDDGVMISLADMTEVGVDPASATAVAQGGASWAELNTATGEHGLAVTGGVISTTGIAGLTLGGGRGRRGARGRRELALGSFLGAARRRRQLRRRHIVHVPPAPGRHGHRWPDRPPVRGGPRAPSLLPRRGGRRLGRVDRVRRPGARTGRLRRKARGPRRLSRRRAGRGRARAGAVHGLRIAADD